MKGSSEKTSLEGLHIIFAESPVWPHSANIIVIPDQNGFSLIDVGCNAGGCLHTMMSGLGNLGLDLEDLHTVVLSHAHPDHMGAIGQILQSGDVEVLLHHLDVEAALDPTLLNRRFDVDLAVQRFGEDPSRPDMAGFDILDFFDDWGCSMSAIERVTPIRDDAVLSLGDFNFTVYNTPGHSPGHIALFDQERGLLYSGDLVGKAPPAWYTPTSGGLIGYLASLKMMKSLEARQIIPAHGTLIEDPQEAIERIEKKLMQREVIILESLSVSGKSFLQVLEALFPADVLHFFPGCGILESHLLKLESEGLITRGDGLIFPGRF